MVIVYLVAGIVISRRSCDISDEDCWIKAKLLAKVAAGACIAIAIGFFVLRAESANFVEGLTILSAYAAHGAFIIYG